MDKEKKSRMSRTALIITATVLCAVLLTVIVAAVVIHRSLNLINYRPQSETKTSQEASSILEDEAEPDDGSAVIPDKPDHSDISMLQGSGIVNILLVGQDRREGQGTQRSDSMILLTFNKSRKELNMISIMRDAYVTIPGYGNDKLCHAYAYGGMELLNRTLYDHFGVQVHGNVEVDFSGFESIIDVLGGVELKLTAAEAEYLNEKYGWQLPAGQTKLSGKQALQYSRIRAIDSDYARAGRQRKVLLSLLNAYKAQSLPTVLDMTERLLPLVTTNIPREQVLKYVVELYPMLKNAKIETLRIPADGTFEEGYIRISENRRMWCQYHIDFWKNRELLQRLFSD